MLCMHGKPLSSASLSEELYGDAMKSRNQLDISVEGGGHVCVCGCVWDCVRGRVYMCERLYLLA